jgi:hypothetical protein
MLRTGSVDQVLEYWPAAQYVSLGDSLPGGGVEQVDGALGQVKGDGVGQPRRGPSGGAGDQVQRLIAGAAVGVDVGFAAEFFDEVHHGADAVGSVEGQLLGSDSEYSSR